MAETNDLNAHTRSINALPNSIPLLNGSRYGGRYGFDTNQSYNIPRKDWDAVKDNPDAFLKLLQWHVNDWYSNQLPRILELERYYEADNNIHYWLSNKRNRADNRIASGLARYITNIQVGYEFGTPLTFGYTNKDNPDDDGKEITDALDDFNQTNDEPYHEKIMGKNLANTGRAYELLYVAEGSKSPSIKAVDPNSAFVVWSTDIDPVELFGVRVYAVNYLNQTNYEVEVYTDDMCYYFEAGDDPASGWTLVEADKHYFQQVPLTEYVLNEERVGAWEPKLDEIDGYDQSLSEMANSQEDFSNATLMINGKIANNTGKIEQMIAPNGQPVYIDNQTNKYTESLKDADGKPNRPMLVQKVLDTKSNKLFLRPFTYDQPNGSKMVSQTTASYLTKALDANEWKIYIDQLLSDIHKDTNTPDTTDQNFAANASGVAMAYKLWGSDQQMAMSETLYQRGLRRRLRLLAIYWSYIHTTGVSVSDDTNPADNIKITFTPNLPKNNQELMTIVQGLVTTNKVSDQTVREQIANVTGIPEPQETQRVKDQQSDDDDHTSDLIAQGNIKTQQMLQQNALKAHGFDSSVNGGDDYDDDQTGTTKNSQAGNSRQPQQQNN